MKCHQQTILSHDSFQLDTVNHLYILKREKVQSRPLWDTSILITEPGDSLSFYFRFIRSQIMNVGDNIKKKLLLTFYVVIYLFVGTKLLCTYNMLNWSGKRKILQYQKKPYLTWPISEIVQLQLYRVEASALLLRKQHIG